MNIRRILRHVAVQNLKHSLQSRRLKLNKQGCKEFEFISNLELYNDNCDIFYELIQELTQQPLTTSCIIPQSIVETTQKKVEKRSRQSEENTSQEVLVLPEEQEVSICSIKAISDQNSPFCPFPKLSKKFFQAVKLTSTSYPVYREKVRVSFIPVNNIRTGMVTFLTSKLLYYSLKMDTSLKGLTRDCRVQWTYQLPKTASMKDPWHPTKQVYPSRMFKIRRNGDEEGCGAVLALLCYKDNQKFGKWSGKLRMGSVKLFNFRARKMLKSVVIKSFNNFEWHQGKCKAFFDFGADGRFFMRIFTKEGYTCLNLTSPKINKVNMKPVAIFRPGKLVSQKRFEFQHLVDTSCSGGVFSMHLRKGGRDSVSVSRVASKTGYFLNKKLSVLYGGSVFRKRVLKHFLLFGRFLLIVHSDSVVLFDCQDQKSVDFECKEFSEILGAAEAKNEGSRRRRTHLEFDLDLRRMLVRFRVEMEFFGEFDLRPFFRYISTKAPHLESEMTYI